MAGIYQFGYTGKAADGSTCCGSTTPTYPTQPTPSCQCATSPVTIYLRIDHTATPPNEYWQATALNYYNLNPTFDQPYWDQGYRTGWRSPTLYTSGGQGFSYKMLCQGGAGQVRSFAIFGPRSTTFTVLACSPLNASGGDGAAGDAATTLMSLSGYQAMSGPAPVMMAAAPDDRATRRQAAINSGRIADSFYAPNMTADQQVEACPYSDICYCSSVEQRSCSHPDRPDPVDRSTCLRCVAGEFDRPSS